MFLLLFFSFWKCEQQTVHLDNHNTERKRVSKGVDGVRYGYGQCRLMLACRRSNLLLQKAHKRPAKTKWNTFLFSCSGISIMFRGNWTKTSQIFCLFTEQLINFFSSDRRLFSIFQRNKKNSNTKLYFHFISQMSLFIPKFFVYL